MKQSALLSPEVSSAITVEEILFKILKEHCRQQPILIAEKWEFYYRGQRENKRFRDFIAELRKLTLSCEFREFLDEAILDRFVCRLKNILHGEDYITCSKSTIETLETDVRYVQSWQYKHQNDVIDIVLVFLLLTLNIFHNFFSCFYCWHLTGKC